MKQRVVFIHGNQTSHWSFGWAPWLKSILENIGHETFFETMPDSIIARSNYWLPFMKDHIKIGADDIIVGWSSGAVAAMRYAENNSVGALILISPCYTDLGDELEKQSGYYDTAWDWGAIKSNCGTMALVWGDNDPFIPQSEFEHIAKQLNPDEYKIKNGGHFINQTEFPEILEIISKVNS